MRGRTQPELLAALKEHDATMKSIKTTSPTKVSIIAEIDKNGTLTNWTMTELCSLSQKKIRGVKFSSLEKAIQGKASAIQSDYLNVLCLLNSEMDGEYMKMRWINLDPTYPFDQNGNFESLETKIHVKDYPLFSTGMSFYDEATEIFYPITEGAYPSLSKVLDSNSVFNKIPPIPLSPALFIAERLATRTGVTLLYRDSTESIKPVVGVAGYNYSIQSQTEFMQNCMDAIAKHWMYSLDSWNVMDNQSIVNLQLQTLSDVDAFIRLTWNDIPGTPIKVCLYASVYDTECLLQRSVVKNRQSIDYDKLFEEMPKALADFEDMLNQLSTAEVIYNPSYVSVLQQMLGKQRASFDALSVQSYQATELLQAICKEVQTHNTELNDYMKEQVALTITQLIETLIHTKEESHGSVAKQRKTA